MANILIVGCGDLGSAIAGLCAKNHTVTGVRRSQVPSINATNTIQADVTNIESLQRLIALQPEIVIYCVSADAQTDASYCAHYVTGLKNVLATQVNNNKLAHVFFVSSTRLYGQATRTILDEKIPAIPADFGGVRLLEAENYLKTMPYQTTCLRLSGIYGLGRLYLVNMAKDVARWPAENHWSNRIHRDDAAAFITFLVEKVHKKQAIADCYIVTDDLPTQQYSVLTWLASQLAINSSYIKIPTKTGGKRLSNARMRATGYVLKYPNFQVGYTEILQHLT